MNAEQDLPDDVKLAVLERMGRLAQSKYNQNLFFGGKGYNLRFLMDTLYYAPDLEAFDNEYWVDTGTEEGNKIADYFEYGTGLYNTKGRKKMIRPKRDDKMKFEGTKKFKGQFIFTKEVKGVKPVFMMTRAVNSVRHERNKIINETLRKMGYG